jgi:hypothetical protein
MREEPRPLPEPREGQPIELGWPLPPTWLCILACVCMFVILPFFIGLLWPT